MATLPSAPRTSFPCSLPATVCDLHPLPPAPYSLFPPHNPTSPGHFPLLPEFALFPCSHSACLSPHFLQSLPLPPSYTQSLSPSPYFPSLCPFPPTSPVSAPLLSHHWGWWVQVAGRQQWKEVGGAQGAEATGTSQPLLSPL